MSLAGKFFYHAVHKPWAELRDLWHDGGPQERHRTAVGREELRAAAARLRVPALAPEAQPLHVEVLTGARFWDLTAFCLHSLRAQSGRPIAAILHDDGSLVGEPAERLLTLFPEARVRSQAELRAQLETHLPPNRFPALHDRWLHYPNIRKLTDPHLAGMDWKLVMDSDLLFFRRPDFLLAWHDAPDRPLHAVDCETSYGYPRPLMEQLAGAPLMELVNVGLCGLDSRTLDWGWLEHVCHRLLAVHGPHYYLEQALVAMLLAGQVCAVAPRQDYVTRPLRVEALACRAVMHHYVAATKRWHFQHNWRRFAP
jgi:hypothetical protein